VVSVSRSFYEFFKVNPEDTVGKLIYDLGNKQWNIPKLRELLETILPLKTKFDNYEVEHDFATIGRRIMLLNARQIERSMGLEKIILLAIEDITQRKEIETVLEKANKELNDLATELKRVARVKSEFLANMSHELRTPLNSINGFSEVLYDETFGVLNEKQKKYVNNVLISGKHLLLLINQILDMAKVEAGKMKLSLSVLPTKSVLNEISMLVADMASKKNLKMTTEISDDLPDIEADELKVKEIIYNLLSNAVKFTPEGGKIGMKARKKLSENVIDLVLLDVIMTDMDGFEVTRKIRQDDANRFLPVILVTALHEIENRVRGIEAGCDDFLSKPFDKTEMLARVRSLLKVKSYNDIMKKYKRELESKAAERTEELKRACEDVKNVSLETIQKLSKASEYRDEFTGTHIKRMSRYSEAVSRRLGLSDSAVEAILYGSSMHDLGKIGIPDYILMKPSKLEPDEWEIMKNHTVLGAKLLEGSDADFLKIGESIARHHHEKWDGSGYPDGLKGNNIPIEGRIAAIADVFDALTSVRPYKKPFSLKKAFEIIREGKGNHFDPDVVDAFFKVQNEILDIKKRFNMPDANFDFVITKEFR